MVVEIEMEACAAKKNEGNGAYTAGDLPLAASLYKEALGLWDQAVAALEQPKSLEVGALVEYSSKGYYGVIMSAYVQFDEYFLKDLGSDKAIWVGDAGGTLRRFARKELRRVTRELLDLRFATVQNLAAVFLKQEDYGEAERWADAALVINGRAPKALMRKGAALLRLNKPGPASDALATAVEVASNDKETRKLLREAEQKRSPTWVCVTGCCGPWGIVCGGPVSQAMPEAVAPAKKRESGEAGDSSDAVNSAAASTAATAEGELKEFARRACSSCGSSSSGSAPSTPRKETVQKGSAFGFGGLGLDAEDKPAAKESIAAEETSTLLAGAIPTVEKTIPEKPRQVDPAPAALEKSARSTWMQPLRFTNRSGEKAWIPLAILPILVLVIALAQTWISTQASGGSTRT